MADFLKIYRGVFSKNFRPGGGVYQKKYPLPPIPDVCLQPCKLTIDSLSEINNNLILSMPTSSFYINRDLKLINI